MSSCSEVREHLLVHGNRDRVPVFQHVVACDACEAFASRVLALENDLRTLSDAPVAPVPDAWVERLLVRPELSRRSTRMPRVITAFPREERPRSTAAFWSVLAHASCLLVGLAIASHSGSPELPPETSIRIQFYQPGGAGDGGGGGGGGEHGPDPSARVDGEERPAPRTPVTPRPLAIDDDVVPPELPEDVGQLFDGLWSPDAVDAPGIELEGPGGLVASDVRPSSGVRGGVGGGDGTGVGRGDGSGVGDGSGGGSGGGSFQPGAWDVDPVLITSGPEPVYPIEARGKLIEGDVILRIRVHVDGSTEVVSVLKSLPYCVDAARSAALAHRWRPALKAGRPVEAFGVITVRFEMFQDR